MGKIAAALSRFTEHEEGFLRALLDLQPLIVLASFSLVVGTFAAPLSPTAAGYAIGASMAFLTGFTFLLGRKAVFAVARKKIEPDMALFMAYGSIGLGLVLLYIVPAVIAGVIPNVRLYFELAYGISLVLVGLWLLDWILAGFRGMKRQYPGRALVGPFFAVSAFGTILTFSSLALGYVIPEISIGLPTLEIATVGVVLAVGSLLGIVYLKIRWGSGKPPEPPS